MLKILSILLLIPAFVFAEDSFIDNYSNEGDTPWRANIQHDYTSYSSSSDKKTTLNLLLDKKIDENLTLYGSFFITNSSVYDEPYNDTNIRELYIDSSVIDNATVKIGKRVFKSDNKKGVQNLGSKPIEDFLWACNPVSDDEFNNCIGINSLYLKFKLSENNQVELLKTIDKHTLPLTIFTSNQVRIKHSANNFDYNITIGKESVDGANAVFYGRESNNDYIEFSLEERVAEKKINQWYAKVKHTDNSNNDLNVPYLEFMCRFFNQVPIGDVLHSNSLTFGKVFMVKKLLINANLSHKKLTHNTACSGRSPEVTKINSIAFILEYPFDNGKITAHHQTRKTTQLNSDLLFGYLPSINNINTSLNSIEVTRKLTHNWSIRLGYHSIKFDFSENLGVRQSVSKYSLKYKF